MRALLAESTISEMWKGNSVARIQERRQWRITRDWDAVWLR